MTRPAALDLLQGTLDVLILRTLQAAPLHGWAVAERIEQISQGVLQVNQGSLYPALHRLEHRGWISADWGVSELGRRARFYRLTPPAEGSRVSTQRHPGPAWGIRWCTTMTSRERSCWTATRGCEPCRRTRRLT